MNSTIALRTAAVVAAVATLAACGGVPDVEDDVPVAVAVPVPAPLTGAGTIAQPSPPADSEPPAGADATADAAPDDEGVETPVPAATGPSAGDAAAFIAADQVPDTHDVDHVVVDLDGDGENEVVATGIRDGVALLRVAWWQDGAYRVLAEDDGGAGDVVESVRVTDLTRDGSTEVLVTTGGNGVGTLAVWSVVERGRLERIEAVGGCHDGRHVYGVVGVRLVDTGGIPAVVASCNDAPLPVADWSEQRYEWSDGAYRLVPATPAPAPAPSDEDDDAIEDDDARDDDARDEDDDDRDDDDRGDDRDGDDEDDDDDDDDDERRPRNQRGGPGRIDESAEE